MLWPCQQTRWQSLGKVAERICYRACTVCEPFSGLDLGCWGFLKLVRKAFEMGLGKGLLRMCLGMAIRSCNDFAIIRHSLAATLKEWEKPRSALWPKCHHGGGHVHLLVPPLSAKGVVEVSWFLFTFFLYPYMTPDTTEQLED